MIHTQVLGSNMLSVLVVDDQPAVRSVLARMIESCGAVCTLAASGREALEALASADFDIAFLDIRLEDGNGLELAATMRARHFDTALVMVTGVGESSAVIEAMRAGAVDYLLKPFRQSDIARAVHVARRVVQQRRDLRRLANLEIEVQDRAGQVLDVLADLDTVRASLVDAFLAAVRIRDRALAEHSMRVTACAVQLAQALGLSREDQQLVERSAAVHDVGKWCLPERVLQSAAPLGPDEVHLVRSHARVGYEILTKIPGLEAVAEVVWAHQEHYDGRGYPRGLVGEQIPLPARIVAVADAIDAMRSDRPYRKGKAIPDIVAELERCAGTQFDPIVVRAATPMLLVAHG